MIIRTPADLGAAMRAGRRAHWNEAVKGLKLPPDAPIQRLRDMAAALPDAIDGASWVVKRQKLRHPDLDRLCNGLYQRAAQIMKAINMSNSDSRL